MMLSEQQLCSTLAPRSFRFYERIQSTQDVALDWLREGAPSGAVVIADEQLAGRGRMNRTWHTPPNSAIAVSFLLRPERDQVGQITMLGALAVAEMAESYGLTEVTIKWPNDVRLQGKKVAGILPEAVWDGDTLLGVALGIGINIRVKFDQPEIIETAINLEDVLLHPVNRAEVIGRVLEALDRWIVQLGSDALFSAWRTKLDTLGQVVRVAEIEGMAVDVDREGALLLQDEGGTLHRMLAGDVRVGG